MTTLQARPTRYKGVEMRSRLEAGFAMWLDQMGWEWEYEPECFASELGQWLPDFRIDIPCVPSTIARLSPVYVEVKPESYAVHPDRGTRDGVQLHELAQRMSSLYETHPTAAAVLVQEGTAPGIILPDGTGEPLDWTWTGLWAIDARRVDGPWPHEWWKGVAA